MEYQEITDLTIKWDSMVFEVTDLKDFDIKELKALFESTHEVLKKYNKDKLVPKEMCELLLQIKEGIEFVGIEQMSPYCEHHGELFTLVQYLLKSFIKGELSDERFAKTINLLN